MPKVPRALYSESASYCAVVCRNLVVVYVTIFEITHFSHHWAEFMFEAKHHTNQSAFGLTHLFSKAKS